MNYLYGIITKPILFPFETEERSNEIVDIFAKDSDGFKGIYPVGCKFIIWYYDSLNNAKAARNIARMQGIVVGKNIARYKYDKDNLVLDEEWIKEQR